MLCVLREDVFSVGLRDCVPVAFYPPFASIAKGEVFVLLYVFCLFVRSTISQQPAGRFTPKFACSMQAYSSSGCVFSPFGGWRPPVGGKRGK